ncbi:MAG: pirin family protein [Actinomycetia bacterium]|nr:pirin family protein [Actinomycetes bacterium]
MTNDVVLQTMALPPSPSPWPAVDPFLFCVHHNDHYPAGNGAMGPAASLEGRQLGQDFADKDGWNMYHGTLVPGFPQHPHRGFETITYARNGFIDHSDSLGAAARFGRGDVQWMTAGGGVVHSEMFPLLDDNGPNQVELFQIWLNLPPADKLVDPHFTMLWDGSIPRLTHTDDQGRTATVTVIAGSLGTGATAPLPPPASWASRPDTDVAIAHLVLEEGAHCTIPAGIGSDTLRMLYLFDGAGATVEDTAVAPRSAVLVDGSAAMELVADAGEGIEILMLQGRPIGEPVARYGPFVMNTEDQIREVFADYRHTQFGGWPWPDDAPVHPADQDRFARHANGLLEAPPPT